MLTGCSHCARHPAGICVNFDVAVCQPAVALKVDKPAVTTSVLVLLLSMLLSTLHNMSVSTAQLVSEFGPDVTAEVVHAMDKELTASLVADFGGRLTADLVAAVSTVVADWRQCHDNCSTCLHV